MSHACQHTTKNKEREIKHVSVTEQFAYIRHSTGTHNTVTQSSVCWRACQISTPSPVTSHADWKDTFFVDVVVVVVLLPNAKLSIRGRETKNCWHAYQNRQAGDSNSKCNTYLSEECVAMRNGNNMFEAKWWVLAPLRVCAPPNNFETDNKADFNWRYSCCLSKSCQPLLTTNMTRRQRRQHIIFVDPCKMNNCFFACGIRWRCSSSSAQMSLT